MRYISPWGDNLLWRMRTRAHFLSLARSKMGPVLAGKSVRRFAVHLQGMHLFDVDIIFWNNYRFNLIILISAARKQNNKNPTNIWMKFKLRNLYSQKENVVIMTTFFIIGSSGSFHFDNSSASKIYSTCHHLRNDNISLHSNICTYSNKCGPLSLQLPRW